MGRGECNFTEKVLFAQERDAAAVIVINYEESERYHPAVLPLSSAELLRFSIVSVARASL